MASIQAVPGSRHDVAASAGLALSAVAVCVGVAWMLFGADLIGRWALGLMVVMLSGGVGAWGLFRDAPPVPLRRRRPDSRTLAEVLDETRRAP